MNEILPPLIQAAPWASVAYMAIRSIPSALLAVTYAISTLTALLHRAPRRRADAREVLAQHPYNRTAPPRFIESSSK